MTIRSSSAASFIPIPADDRQEPKSGEFPFTNVQAEEPSVSDEARRTGVTIEAEYALETPVRCPACGERVATLKAVRLIRARVNFTSTLPRRGRVVVCPHCFGIVPAELTNF